jgi:hypothetical protein
MRRATQTIWILCLLTTVFSCAKKDEVQTRQPVYQDVAYQQDFSIKYFPEDKNLKLLKVASDRNGNVQILSNKGLLKTYSGKLLYPGTLVPEK